jgi:hypothetical protein
MTVKELFPRPRAHADRGAEEPLRAGGAEERSRAGAAEERSRAGGAEERSRAGANEERSRRDAAEAEAESLIADLAALIDAGLVVVHPQVLGPARYGPRLNLDDAA